MHVLHVIESLEFGGAEKVVVHLANKLCKTHKVSVCLVKRKGELIDELSDDIDVHCLFSGEGNDFSVPGKIKEIVLNNNIQVIHSHNWSVFIESSIARLMIKNVKLIHTIHGPYMSHGADFKSKVKKFVRHLIEKKLSQYSQNIIAVSDSIKDYIINDKGINASIVKTIHNGVSPLNITIKKKEVSGAIKFISVGRLAKIKNHYLMLDAFKIALGHHIDLELSIIGDGPERTKLMDYAHKLDIMNNVTFLGFRDDIVDLLQQNNVFLLSSDYEGISIALLEAMRLSMPAVATDVGGIPETIINNVSGILVKKGDVTAYAKAICSYVKEPSLITQHGDNAFKVFEEEFREDNVLEQYQLVYNK